MNALFRWISRHRRATLQRWINPNDPLFANPDPDHHDWARDELLPLIQPLATLLLIGVETKLCAALAEYASCTLGMVDGSRIAFARDFRDRCLRTLSPPQMLDYHIAAWALTGVGSHIDFVLHETQAPSTTDLERATVASAQWVVGAITGDAWKRALAASSERTRIPIPTLRSVLTGPDPT